jgi:hypothetical protein
VEPLPRVKFACLQVLDPISRNFTVRWEGTGVEEHRTIGAAIRVPLLQQPHDQVDHQVDVLAGPRGVLRRAQVERARVGVERVLVEPRELQRRLPLTPRLREDLVFAGRVDLGVVHEMAHVGDVAAHDHPHAAPLEHPPDQVGEQI